MKKYVFLHTWTKLDVTCKHNLCFVWKRCARYQSKYRIPSKLRKISSAPPTHYPLPSVQIYVKQISTKSPSILLFSSSEFSYLRLGGGMGRSGIPLFMSISCFFFCWRSCFSRSAFSFASLALLIFSSISLFLWFSFTASWWDTRTETQTQIKSEFGSCHSHFFKHIHYCIVFRSSGMSLGNSTQRKVW